MPGCILIVEDDKAVQGMIRAALEKGGHETHIAETGAGMFAALDRLDVDLIILDLGLPDGDALPHIQQLRNNSMIPLIVLTGRQKIDDRLMALGLGADDYLTKPVDSRELLLRVGNILARGGIQSKPVIATGLVSAQPITPTETIKPKRETGLVYGTIIFLLLIGAVGYWLFSPDTGGKTPSLNASRAPATAIPDQPPSPTLSIETNGVSTTSEEVEKTTETGQSVEQEQRSDKTPLSSPDKNFLAAEQTIEPGKPTKAEILGYGWVHETKCESVPYVEWWKFRTHEEIVNYVLRRHAGDWRKLENNLTTRLAKLYDISDRDSGARVMEGLTLKGEALTRYIGQFTKRLEIVRCLAAEAAAAR